MRPEPGPWSSLPPPAPRPQDTLRDCTHDERSCLSSLQFVSPLYFVSFVLTAQFVLINVVVAVLMKHLDDSNKEAQEDAEMDAELELEMAQGLGPGPRPPAGGGDPEGHLCPHCYSPAQVGRGWGRPGRHLGAAGEAARVALGGDLRLLGGQLPGTPGREDRGQLCPARPAGPTSDNPTCPPPVLSA